MEFQISDEIILISHWVLVLQIELVDLNLMYLLYPFLPKYMVIFQIHYQFNDVYNAHYMISLVS